MFTQTVFRLLRDFLLFEVSALTKKTTKRPYRLDHFMYTTSQVHTSLKDDIVLKINLFSIKYQDKFVMISSAPMPDGLIFRLHYFFKHLKIMIFTHVLNLTERKSFGNICVICIFMILTRLGLTSC